MADQLYRFIDKSGKCFEAFQHIGEVEYTEDGKPYGERVYNDHVGAMLRASHHDGRTFIVGDMMVFKNDLIEAGFEYGKDFYVIKVNKP